MVSVAELEARLDYNVEQISGTEPKIVPYAETGVDPKDARTIGSSLPSVAHMFIARLDEYTWLQKKEYTEVLRVARKIHEGIINSGEAFHAWEWHRQGAFEKLGRAFSKGYAQSKDAEFQDTIRVAFAARAYVPAHFALLYGCDEFQEMMEQERLRTFAYDAYEWPDYGFPRADKDNALSALINTSIKLRKVLDIKPNARKYMDRQGHFFDV